MGPHNLPWGIWLAYALAFLVPLVAFIVISIWAWKGNVAVVRSWRDWWANRHERRRYRTDPGYRLLVDTAAEYQEAIMAMALWHAVTESRPESKWRVEKFFAARDAAADFLAGLAGERFDCLATHLHEQLLDSRVPLQMVRDWLAEEVEIAKYAPYKVRDHVHRCSTHFYEAYGFGQTAENGQAAP